MTNPSALSFEHMAVSAFARERRVRSLFEGATTSQMSDVPLELIIACQVGGLTHSQPRANNLMLKCF